MNSFHLASSTLTAADTKQRDDLQARVDLFLWAVNPEFQGMAEVTAGSGHFFIVLNARSMMCVRKVGAVTVRRVITRLQAEGWPVFLTPDSV